jgi:hypothetical protein
MWDKKNENQKIVHYCPIIIINRVKFYHIFKAEDQQTLLKKIL